jgi:beta-lactamase class A
MIIGWICLISCMNQSEQMSAKVEAIAKEAGGTLCLYALNLKSKKSYGIREDSPCRTASTIKLPILAAAHAEVKAGRLAWNEKLVLGPKSRTGGAGILPELGDGLALSVKDASRLMMVLSDNTATNMILDRMGTDRVNGHLEDWGFKVTRSMRKIGAGGESKAFHMPDNKRADGSTYGIGRSTAREMVELLARLDSGTLVSPEDSKEMLALMGRQQGRDGLARGDMKVRVAAKAGALDRLRSEVGILRTPKATVAMAITFDDLPETNWSVDNKALVAIGRLSQALLEGLPDTP